ncbi:hypothetical protein OF83DRAFT_1125778 [Amylostereum chailletii]|nr:hypothetical protein OF83DRAFT_1125778 [Amylostereum chailletii]
MQIFCPATSCAGFLVYLQDEEGYRLIGPASPEALAKDVNNPYVTSSFTLKHDIRHTSVRLSCTIDLSPLLAITNAWGTHLMNFLLADTFCIGYPEFTFMHRTCMNPSWRDTAPDAAIDAAVVRGFHVLAFDGGNPVHFKGQDSPYCPHFIRAFGDGACMVVSLQDEDEATDSVWDKNVLWRWGGDRGCGGLCQGGSTVDHCAVVPWCIGDDTR